MHWLKDLRTLALLHPIATTYRKLEMEIIPSKNLVTNKAKPHRIKTTPSVAKKLFVYIYSFRSPGPRCLYAFNFSDDICITV